MTSGNAYHDTDSRPLSVTRAAKLTGISESNLKQYIKRDLVLLERGRPGQGKSSNVTGLDLMVLLVARRLIQFGLFPKRAFQYADKIRSLAPRDQKVRYFLFAGNEVVPVLDPAELPIKISSMASFGICVSVDVPQEAVVV